MKKIVAIAIAVGFVAGIAVAQLPAEKLQELSAAGITNWTPGTNEGVIAKIPSVPAPSNPAGDTQTMQYDDGNITALPVGFGQIWGNRFQLGVGGVNLSTMTLNSFSFYFFDTVADTGMFFQPADPLNATSISARATVNITGLTNSGPSFTTPVLNVVPQSALGTGGTFSNTFYLGGWTLNANTTFPVDNEAIGLATNTTGIGSGYRGYTADSGTGAQPFAAGSFQAILRANVTSPNPVPVELMAFDVEE